MVGHIRLGQIRFIQIVFVRIRLAQIGGVGVTAGVLRMAIARHMRVMMAARVFRQVRDCDAALHRRIAESWVQQSSRFCFLILPDRMAEIGSNIRD